MGEVEGGENVLCRMYSACIGGHVFNSVECECAAKMAAAQSAIQKEGRGVIVYLDQEGKGNGHLALIESLKYKKEFGQAAAYEKAGFVADARSFRPAAEILAQLKVASIVLLTNNSAKTGDLRQAGIIVAETRHVTLA